MFSTTPSTRWTWITAAVLALLVGTYPLAYLLTDIRSHGVLQGKSMETLNSAWYLPAFYMHISFGGLALAIGWIQFSEKWRARRIRVHRSIGKLYMLSVLLSSLAGLFISFYSYGGIITTLGFGLLALSWLFTDIKGYLAIRGLDIVHHRRWMIRNYALAFAAVTLRIYLPVSTMLLSASFLNAYRIISWACWIPNLIVAEFLIRRLYPPIAQPA
jgi:uncharacterized membrane protein